MSDPITGIQQIGIGVSDANHAKLLYKDLFRMDALIFDDQSPATLMTRYTGNEIHHRHAILSMNLSGGGGFEIWQFTSRKPTSPSNNIQFGDTGIFAAKIKCQNIEIAHQYYKKYPGLAVSAINENAFWLKDMNGNNFQLIASNEWFHSNNHICGGVAGAVIGVTNMERSLDFYKKVLGLSEVIFDKTIFSDDLTGDGQSNEYRSVLLHKKKNIAGAFSKLLGDVQIELVQPLNNNQRKIFENRYWGDCGFIHLCFDVLNMDELKKTAEGLGYVFTVDSKDSYAMETSSGRFCYVEDPDGTLIELVETHKIPVYKKFGWHIDLKKRKKDSPLPDWMIKMLGLNKVK